MIIFNTALQQLVTKEYSLIQHNVSLQLSAQETNKNDGASSPSKNNQRLRVQFYIKKYQKNWRDFGKWNQYILIYLYLYMDFPKGAR